MYIDETLGVVPFRRRPAVSVQSNEDKSLGGPARANRSAVFLLRCRADRGISIHSHEIYSISWLFYLLTYLCLFGNGMEWNGFEMEWNYLLKWKKWRKNGRLNERTNTKQKEIWMNCMLLVN